MKWRRQYDQKALTAVSQATATSNTEPSLTHQAPAQDCDINVLVKRFGLSDGAIPVQMFDPAFFADFSDVPDLRTALDRVRAGSQAFGQLPAELRRRFDNDPANLWYFVNNPENRAEAEALGLLRPRSPVDNPGAPNPAPTTPNDSTGAPTAS